MKRNILFSPLSAKATYTAMQRERVREMIVKTGVPVSEYYYATSLGQLRQAYGKTHTHKRRGLSF